jgi:hypothetical protein
LGFTVHCAANPWEHTQFQIGKAGIKPEFFKTESNNRYRKYKKSASYSNPMDQCNWEISSILIPVMSKEVGNSQERSV